MDFVNQLHSGFIEGIPFLDLGFVLHSEDELANVEFADFFGVGKPTWLI